MLMARLLGQDAHLVSYGAMSKQPLSLSTSQLIFKNLKCHGFWQTRWYKDHDRSQREQLMNKLVALVHCGKLREPKHDIVTIGAHLTDDEATVAVRTAVKRAVEGRCGKKLLLRIEDPLTPSLTT
jgi:NADPH:quinone reductase-like Zn-dependent oxidoreductase